jgi:hypothetical protein
MTTEQRAQCRMHLAAAKAHLTDPETGKARNREEALALTKLEEAEHWIIHALARP